MSIEMNEEQRGEIIIFHLQGRLDAVSSPLIEELVNQKQESLKYLAFDFKNVDYTSSAGLRLLLSITKKLKDRSGAFGIFNVSEEVMETISLAGFNYILNIYEEKDILELAKKSNG